MKQIGVSFFVNDAIHSDYLLSDLLLDVIDPTWYWQSDGGENYQVEGEGYNRILTPLFSVDELVLTGEEFRERITTTRHYVITAALKAFLVKEDIVDILDFHDFEISSCQLAIIIMDTGFVSIYLKDELMIQQFVENAYNKGCTSIKIINEDHAFPPPHLTI
ncbi:DUF2691 family protein [Solibacillus sp. FSL K6-4121]|uniref:DUF2691 family protein n=1 Tax=Solibacillus sp. FSL K6-4121 TaxID=2921505 RepID=UPI0030F70AB4